MNDNYAFRQSIRRQAAHAVAEKIADLVTQVGGYDKGDIKVFHGFFPGSVEIEWGSRKVSNTLKKKYEAELRAFFGPSVRVEKYRASKHHGHNGGIVINVGY